MSKHLDKHWIAFAIPLAAAMIFAMLGFVGLLLDVLT